MTLLTVENLRVEYPTPRGPVVAVDDVSLEVGTGAAVGLVGESGCGKTTTLRTLVGLLRRPARVTGGRVWFDGRNVLDLDTEGLRRLRGGGIAVVFQEPMTALNPLMRVGRQIAESVRAGTGAGKTAARARAVELMRRVGIPDPERRARAYPHELSGGMRQRVVIAIALAGEPRLLLCDEPTTALDVTIQDQILGLLAGLRDETGLGLLYVTHDLPVVAQLCEEVVVMYAGKVVEAGPVREVFTAPAHPYTRGLLRSTPTVDGAAAGGVLHSVPGAPPDLADPPPGCRFHPRCDLALASCAHGDFPLLPVPEPEPEPGPGEGRRAGNGAAHDSACVRAAECVESVRREPILVED